MLGAIIYRLRAKETGSLVEFHGKLLHGALFKILNEIDPEASQRIHDQVRSKIFSSGLLEPENPQKNSRDLAILSGNVYRWRVAALNEEMLKLLLSIREGTEIRIGRNKFVFEEIVADGRYKTGVVEEKILVAGALEINNARAITFQFITPATFRRDNMDYPFPLPELVFGSLARKWCENGMPVDLDPEVVKEKAWYVKPFAWKGHSVMGYSAKNQGVTGFIGKFTYSLDDVSSEWRQIFLMLAQYADFAGVGRITGQGFGRVITSWR